MKNNFRKILAALLALIFMLSAAAFAETVSLANKSGSLHIRKGPGTEYKSVGTVHHGDYITVLEHGEVWSKIKTESGKTGYIKNLYIFGSSGSSYATATDYYSKTYTAYTTGKVNFRAGAHKTTASMGTLPAGTKLTVLGENGDFYLVKNSKGTQGFVSKNYISKKKPANVDPAPETDQATVCLAYKGGSIHLRKGAGTEYKSLGTLKHGNAIEVLQYGDVWSKVKTSGGNTGYIKNVYIKSSRSEYAAGVKYYDSTFSVYSTGSVNFRAGASTSTATMGSLPWGTKVTALGENNGFYLVETAAGEQGFMSKKYASKTKPQPTATPVPETTPEPDNSYVIDALVGEWQDSWSQRAKLSITNFGNTFTVVIDWANSAFENVQWRMTGTLEMVEEGRITAYNCAKYTITSAEDGSTMETLEYENGYAHLTLLNGILYWHDGVENMGDECMFEKVGYENDMRDFYNPNRYQQIRISDIFIPDGSNQAVVQGCFGTIDESGMEVGFDESEIFTIPLMLGCEIMMPADLTNPVLNMECTMPDIWFRNAEAVMGTPYEPFSFLANFSMNEAGEITYLSYCYMP